jgi:outer membrane protein assembly factor BamB
MWGYGSSPILVNDRVYLNCSPSKKRTFVTAIDLKSGDTLWETDEPMDGNGERNTADQYMGSWATPIVVTIDGKQQLICAHPTRLVGYDLDSGDILWWCNGIRGERGDLAYSSPLCDGKICLTTGGFGGPSIAVRLGGSGDITGQQLWRKPENPQSIGSGILRDGVYYMANADVGTLQCLEATTGKELWVARGGAAHWGSIVAAGDLMYVTNQSGETTVFRFNPQQLEKVATNDLPEASNSTPAIVGDEIFVRTMEHLYCIGE